MTKSVQATVEVKWDIWNGNPSWGAWVSAEIAESFPDGDFDETALARTQCPSTDLSPNLEVVLAWALDYVAKKTNTYPGNIQLTVKVDTSGLEMACRWHERN